MRTINITLQLTDQEWELLTLGKCEKPSDFRIKLMLLSEAARNLRNMSESVIAAARAAHLPPKFKTLADIEADNKRKLERINKAAQERAAKQKPN